MTDDLTAPMASTDEADGLSEQRTGWLPGEAMGRYLALRAVGAGGCGEVLAAFDPVLDRNIALKLLRRRGDSASLLREARALARLSHPNIVTIHDAGVVDGRPFLAMELIEGADLADWLKHNEPAPETIVGLLCSAADGLAAAHERGIVHGDIKPANLLVSDTRMVITDFGVAVWAAENPQSGPDSTRADKQAQDEVGGSIRLVGTPAYMAPEQYLGATANAASDQYAFCQTAWEALFRQPAFAVPSTFATVDGDPDASRSALASEPSGGSAAAVALLADEKQRGAPATPANTHVPRRVAAALQRGLNPDPQLRWPDMAALLVALRHDPAPKRRVWFGSLAALGLAAATSIGTTALVTPEPPCRGAAEAWGQRGETRWAQVDNALGGSDSAYAEDVRAFVTVQLRAQSQAWQAMHTDACEAHAVRRDQSDRVHDQRMLCLDRARQRYDALTQVLIDEGEALLPSAHRIVAGLSSVETCGDLQALEAEAMPPSSDADRLRAQEISSSLSQAYAVQRAGHYEAADAAYAEVVTQARQLEHPPLLAEALQLHGDLIETMGRYDEAETTLLEATDLAWAHGPSRVALLAASTLAFLYAVDKRQPERARVYGDLTASAVRRTFENTTLHATVLINQSATAYAVGDLDRADALDRAALRIREDVLGKDHLTLALSLENLSQGAMYGGDFVEAERLARRAVQIWTEKLGPQHPSVAQSLINLGQVIHGAGGRDREATGLLRKALSAQEAALGPAHPDLARTLLALGEAHDQIGELEAGRAALERGLAIAEAHAPGDDAALAPNLHALGGYYILAGELDKAVPLIRRAIAGIESSVGPEHVELAPMLQNLGSAQIELGKTEEGAANLRRSLALFDSAFGPGHPDTSVIHLSLARAAHDLGDAKRALAEAQAAFDTTLDPTDPTALDHPRQVRPLLALARAFLALDRSKEATVALRTAAKISASDEVQPMDRGDVHLLLATTLWSAGERDDARAAGTIAAEAFELAGPDLAKDASEARSWVSSHR